MSKKEFLNFLKKENTAYSIFILKRYFRELSTFSKITEFQTHHIQPKHSHGTNASWNLILLSLPEHAEGHKLLYECYNNIYDYSAWCLMTGKTLEGLTVIRKENQLKMKTRKIGFYNSEIQRELAKRPKKRRQPFSRNRFIVKALEQGFILQSIKTKDEILFEPNKYKNLHEVIERWLTHIELTEYQSKWRNCTRKERFYLYTGLTRSLTGHRDKKNKSLYSIVGWRILGIFL